MTIRDPRLRLLVKHKLFWLIAGEVKSINSHDLTVYFEIFSRTQPRLLQWFAERLHAGETDRWRMQTDDFEFKFEAVCKRVVYDEMYGVLTLGLSVKQDSLR